MLNILNQYNSGVFGNSRSRYQSQSYGWNSTETNEGEEAIQRKLAHLLGPLSNIDPIDVQFLLNKVGTSKSKDVLINLLIKLKLEYSDELAERTAQREALRRKQEEDYKQYAIAMKIQNKTRIDDFEKKAAVFEKQTEEIQIYLRDHWIGSLDDLPEQLRQTFSELEKQNIISKPWFWRWSVIPYSRIVNPYKMERDQYITEQGLFSGHIDYT